jgi:DNA-binding GntR family transcriptional regulator
MNSAPKNDSAVRPAQYIREHLEQAILLGEYVTGARLDETRLGEQFGVSRTPVREALQLLTASGLVEHRPNRGAFVRSPTAKELYEMFEVMAELEAMCGRLASRRVSAADLKHLQSLTDACEQARQLGNSDHYYRENEVLHSALYTLSGNEYLAVQARELHRRLQPYRRLQLRVPHRMRQSMHEHRQIIDALSTGDAEQAARLMRSHVAVLGEKFHDLLAVQAAALQVS